MAPRRGDNNLVRRILREIFAEPDALGGDSCRNRKNDQVRLDLIQPAIRRSWDFQTAGRDQIRDLTKADSAQEPWLTSLLQIQQRVKLGSGKTSGIQLPPDQNVRVKQNLSHGSGVFPELGLVDVYDIPLDLCYAFPAIAR